MEELLSMVGAGDEGHCHTDGVALSEEGWARGIVLKYECVPPSWARVTSTGSGV